MNYTHYINSKDNMFCDKIGLNQQLVIYPIDATKHLTPPTESFAYNLFNPMKQLQLILLDYWILLEHTPSGNKQVTFEKSTVSKRIFYT